MFLIIGALLFFLWEIGDFFDLIEEIPAFLGVFFKVIFGLVIILLPLQFYSTYYVLTDKEIQVYFLWGIISKPPVCRILISTITSVKRSYNLYKAPAFSLKRLRICFDKKKDNKWDEFYMGMPMISPAREQKFLETLKALNPNIQINVNDKKAWWRFWNWDF
jgi:hypothetical protein